MRALKFGCSFNKSRGCVVKQIIFAKYQQECLLKVVFIIVAKHVRLCRERELTKQFKMVLETSLIRFKKILDLDGFEMRLSVTSDGTRNILSWIMMR